MLHFIGRQQITKKNKQKTNKKKTNQKKNSPEKQTKNKQKTKKTTQANTPKKNNKHIQRKPKTIQQFVLSEKHPWLARFLQDREAHQCWVWLGVQVEVASNQGSRATSSKVADPANPDLLLDCFFCLFFFP